jgi:hypothetical protein
MKNIYRHFYYLICSLKSLNIDMEQTPYSLKDFNLLLKEELSLKDFGQITLFSYKYDNKNLINILNKKEEFKSLGVFTKEELLERKNLPSYMKAFLDDFNKNPKRKGKLLSIEDELSLYYYKYIKENANSFLKKYTEFTYNIKNIHNALTCRKHNLNLENYILQVNDISEKLLKSKANDFDLSKDLSYFSKIQSMFEKIPLKDKERAIDVLKYNYVEEELTMEDFTATYLLGYYIKLSIIDRWANISLDKGTEIFNTNVSDLTNKAEEKMNELLEEI